MEMEQLIRFTVFLLCCLTVVLSTETDKNKYNDLTRFVVDSFNQKPNSVYVYNSASLINSYMKNGSEPLYFLQLDINVSCKKSSTNCAGTNLICEVIIREASTSIKEILEDKSKCAVKETDSVLPTNGHGFGEETVSDEVRRIAAFAVQQSTNNEDNKRNVVDIMSTKKQTIGNSTTLYLTLKVAKTEGGDALLFEVCEAEVNKTSQTALESNLTCFPLSRMQLEAPLSADDVTAVAERAADELDSLSYSEFTLKLLDVLKAESTVTQGSEGTMTSLELRLAPTLCLKNVDVDSDTDGIYEHRKCPENTSNKRLICSVTSWDRPWLDDTLYSEPSCRQDLQSTTEYTSETAGTPLDTMMNDQMEAVSEDSSLPAVEHHSIPVVEELDPIVELIVPSGGEHDTAVVEEPIVAKHTYCTGCPIDIDINNLDLKKFVDQALVDIDKASRGNLLHKGKIIKAQKQVVNGVKYILHLQVAESSCSKDSNQDRSSCESDMNSAKICLVEFLEKPWIDASFAVVSNNCTEFDNNLENEIIPHVAKENNAARQDIFDYLDAMDDTEPLNSDAPSPYGKDGLYLPENEPENHPLETDAEKIDTPVPKGNKKSMKSKADKLSNESSNGKSESDNSESFEKGHLVVKQKDSSEESSEEEEHVTQRAQEDIMDQISAYIMGEDRNRREIAPSDSGALKNIVDSEKELVNKLAQISVQTLDEVDADDSKRVVLNVLGAQKRLLNGVMYHLQLRVGTTSCSENGATKSNCMQDHLSPVKICKVELHRSFADNSELDAKVVKSECVLEEVSTTVKKLREKRSTSGSVVGGTSPADTNDEYIVQTANFAVSELDKSTNSLYKQCVVRIHNASKQVVSGYIVTLNVEVADSIHRKGEAHNGTCVLNENSETKMCLVTIWDRPWLDNAKQITSSNCSAVNSGTERFQRVPSNKVKRNVGVPGGRNPVDVNDPYIREIASLALSTIDSRSNSEYRQKIVTISQAETQIVSGTNYHITMELGTTTCLKNQNVDVENCSLDETQNNQICSFTVWDRPWLSKREVTNSSCHPSTTNTGRSKREQSLVRKRRHSDRLVGAPSQADVNDPYIQEVAATALAHIDGQSNALYKQKLVRVVEARKQVVAGMRVSLTLELGYTSCRKGQDGDVNNCTLKEDSNNQICHVEVWDRPWLHEREIKNVTCSPASESAASTSVSRSKRELPPAQEKKHSDVLVGAPTKANLSDPYILEMADHALAEVDKRSNALYRQKIVRILDAEKQVVAGVLVRLTLELGYSTCRKGHSSKIDSCEFKENSNNQICHVEVWDKPWLHKREVKNVSCGSFSKNRLKRKSFIGGGSHDIHIGLFNEFVEKYKKQYTNKAEYKRRFHIFRANMKKIEHLQNTEQGTAKYGATQFVDLSSKEFKKYHLGLNPKLKDHNNIPLHEAKIPDVELPKEFDWRHYNVVTEVKNQGSCGSCWAFSVTGNVEGQWALKKGRLYSLSEQELVDCDSLDEGCNGGLPENAYKSIEKLGGLETEKDYPYEGEDEKCHFDRSDVKVTIQGAVNITKNETKMAQWLYKNGPISIGINANAMQFYMGGVSHPWKFLCDKDNLDHGVLIVGYGVHTYPMFQKVLPFWIIKNSWGSSWGEQGYYRVYRGDGTCGVNEMATSALVE